MESKFYRIGSYDVSKISLSCFDDKRYIVDDGISSLVYFYKNVKISKFNKINEINKRQ